MVRKRNRKGFPALRARADHSVTPAQRVCPASGPRRRRRLPPCCAAGRLPTHERRGVSSPVSVGRASGAAGRRLEGARLRSGALPGNSLRSELATQRATAGNLARRSKSLMASALCREIVTSQNPWEEAQLFGGRFPILESMKIEIPAVPASDRTPLVEALLAIIDAQQQRLAQLEDTVQQLRDEIALLKGQKPRPQIAPSR